MKKPLNVTFDTNIFDESQFDLSKNSPISQLVKYVNHGDIRVFLSNIVIGEMKQHCT
ncbi:MAG: PIN domain-containing protein [Ruminococcus flavefaciens]|nr:PIN domain-containing protein [Ruminococcus flavefaciens]